MTLKEKSETYKGHTESKLKGENAERNALLIDFYRECFGNYSLESSQCPFCPQGLECQHEATIKMIGGR